MAGPRLTRMGTKRIPRPRADKTVMYWDPRQTQRFEHAVDDIYALHGEALDKGIKQVAGIYNSWAVRRTPVAQSPNIRGKGFGRATWIKGFSVINRRGPASMRRWVGPGAVRASSGHFKFAHGKLATEWMSRNAAHHIETLDHGGTVEVMRRNARTGDIQFENGSPVMTTLLIPPYNIQYHARNQATRTMQRVVKRVRSKTRARWNR